MAREPCPSRGTLAFCGRRRASASLRTRAYPLGDSLSGGGETDRLSAGIQALSVSTNVRQQKTPESSKGDNLQMRNSQPEDIFHCNTSCGDVSLSEVVLQRASPS